MMHLFDEGPFNVMLLGSISGSDYQIDNRQFGIGGVFEGTQLFEVAKWAKSGVLGKYTSDVHIIGVSLGGHAALYASLFSSLNLDNDQQPYLSSVISFCPVVQLKDAIDFLYTKGSRTSVDLFNRKSWQSLYKIRGIIPSLGKLLPSEGALDPNRLINIIVRGSLDYYRRYSQSGNQLPSPFDKERIRTKRDFWKLNNFLSYSHLVTTPTLVVSAENDPVVRYYQNAKPLKNKHRGLTGTSLNVVSTWRGSHCGFSVTYGWKYISELVRAFVSSHSSKGVRNELKIKPRYIRFNLRNQRQLLELESEEEHSYNYWLVSPYRSVLDLYFVKWSPESAFNKDMNSCYIHSVTAKTDCFKGVKVDVPYSALPAGLVRRPRSHVEAQGLTRWLNTHVQVLDINGQILWKSKMEPAYLRVY